MQKLLLASVPRLTECVARLRTPALLDMLACVAAMRPDAVSALHQGQLVLMLHKAAPVLAGRAAQSGLELRQQQLQSQTQQDGVGPQQQERNHQDGSGGAPRGHGGSSPADGSDGGASKGSGGGSSSSGGEASGPTFARPGTSPDGSGGGAGGTVSGKDDGSRADLIFARLRPEWLLWVGAAQAFKVQGLATPEDRAVVWQALGQLQVSAAEVGISVAGGLGSLGDPTTP